MSESSVSQEADFRDVSMNGDDDEGSLEVNYYFEL